MTQKHQIQLFEEKKVRTVWNDELQEWFFNVTDVVEVLTDSVDVKQYIKKISREDEGALHTIFDRLIPICTARSI